MIPFWAKAHQSERPVHKDGTRPEELSFSLQYSALYDRLEGVEGIYHTWSHSDTSTSGLSDLIMAEVDDAERFPAVVEHIMAKMHIKKVQPRSSQI